MISKSTASFSLSFSLSKHMLFSVICDQGNISARLHLQHKNAPTTIKEYSQLHVKGAIKMHRNGHMSTL